MKTATEKPKKNSKAKDAPAPAPELRGEPMTLAVGMLVPNPHNRRHWLEDDKADPELLALRDSIERTGGNIQRVLVRAKGEAYEILAGERRFRAIRMSKTVQTVNCECYVLNDDQAFEFCMAENARRKNLQPLEEADTAASWMAARPGWTLDDLAAAMGLSRQTAARRLSLGALIQCWRDSAANPEHWASRWGSGHMERIAALPAGTQETLWNKLGGSSGCQYHMRDFSMNQLIRVISDMCRTLESVPWALDEGDNPCTKCPKRSSCQPDLWDGVDLSEDADERKQAKEVRAVQGDTCLDGECFDAKLQTIQRARLEELRAKHPDLVVAVEWSEQTTDWMGATAKRYELNACKKNTPGAFPVIRLSDLEGGVKWMKTDNPAAERKIAKEQEKAKPAAQVLKEKRANLDKLRWKIACSFIHRDLCKMLDKGGKLPELSRDQILALVHVGGTNNNHGSKIMGNGKFWQEVLKAEKDEQDSIQKLYVTAAGVIAHRLKSLDAFTEADFQGEADGVCIFFRLDSDAYWAEACAAKKEPKSWAKDAAKAQDE